MNDLSKATSELSIETDSKSEELKNFFEKKKNSKKQDSLIGLSPEKRDRSAEEFDQDIPNLKKYLAENIKAEGSNKELESSHKMLIELSKIHCEIDYEDQEKEQLQKDEKSQEEVEGVENDMYAQHEHSDLKEVVSKHIPLDEIITTNPEEIECLKQELIQLIGERVFKAAYSIVYENVSLILI